MRRLMVVGAFMVLCVIGVYSQEDAEAQIINAENITRLQSVATIDFADFTDEAGEFDSGWFAINADGTLLATVNNTDEIIIWNDGGQVIARFASELEGDTIDVAFFANEGVVYSLHTIEGGVQVIARDLVNDTLQDETLITQGIPVDLWIDDGDRVWAEFLSDESFVARLDNDLFQIPSALENDPNAFVRIGRIDPPYAITSSLEGVVTLWDMETGEILAQVQVEDGPAVFGQINASASHLVWRDPNSTGLHVLNFETGEDQFVAELNGSYLQFYALTVDADMVIGVNLDDAPIVVAWDVATGERYDLEDYRACGRVPDMVRLSEDGTTLVIGCDAGLDIWRVVDG